MKEKKGLFGTLFAFVSDIVYLLLHIVVFYILPIRVSVDESNRMVVIQFFLTFILGLMMGGFIHRRAKFLYPFAAVIAYLPSVFIFYTAENISYCLWIFIASFLGVIFGQLALKPKFLPRAEKSKKEKHVDEKKAEKQAKKDKAALEALDSFNETNKVGNTIPLEFDITDSDVVPDVSVPQKESFGKRFFASLKRAFAEKKQKKTKESKDGQEN